MRTSRRMRAADWIRHRGKATLTQRYSLKSIWEESALPDLAYSFKLAMGPAKIIIAFSGVFAVCVLGAVMDTCSRNVLVYRPDNAAEGLSGRSELDIYIANPAQMKRFIQEHQMKEYRQGVFSTLWKFAAGRFHAAVFQLLNLDNANLFANVKFALTNIWLCIRAVGWAFRFHPIYSLIFFTAAFLIFVFVGGTICRCAALEFAQSEKPGLLEAVGYMTENYRAFLSAPLLPMGLVGLAAFGIFAIGLIGSIPQAGELIIAILFGLLLVFGFMITVMVMGTIAGGLLLFPAIAYEKTTGLDSIGRSFCYVLNCPIRMFYYVLVSGIFGTFFYLIIRLILFGILRFTYGLLLAGMMTAGADAKLKRIWPKPDFMDFLKQPSGAVGWTESAASLVIYVFMLIIVGLLLSYVVSYVFSTATVIYALMRRKVDNVELNRVYVHLEQISKNTQPELRNAYNRDPAG